MLSPVQALPRIAGASAAHPFGGWLTSLDGDLRAKLKTLLQQVAMSPHSGRMTGESPVTPPGWWLCAAPRTRRSTSPCQLVVSRSAPARCSRCALGQLSPGWLPSLPDRREGSWTLPLARRQRRHHQPAADKAREPPRIGTLAGGPPVTVAGRLYPPSMTYVDLRPHDVRPVRVVVDGRWRDGELEAYRQDSDGTWRGWVRWSEGVGLTRIGRFREDAIPARTRHGARAPGELPLPRPSSLLRLPADRRRLRRQGRSGARPSRLRETTLDTYAHLWPDSDESTRAVVGAAFADRADYLRIAGGGA